MQPNLQHALERVERPGCCVLFCLCGFVFVFLLLFLVCDDFVTDWTMHKSFTRSLLKPLNLQAAMYFSRPNAFMASAQNKTAKQRRGETLDGKNLRLYAE